MQEKCSCSKEPSGTIPIMRIIEKIDDMFEKDDLQGAKRVLEYWEKEAKALNDAKGLLEVLSEQIGLYRKLGEKDKGLAAVGSRAFTVQRHLFERGRRHNLSQLRHHNESVWQSGRGYAIL